MMLLGLLVLLVTSAWAATCSRPGLEVDRCQDNTQFPVVEPPRRSRVTLKEEEERWQRIDRDLEQLRSLIEKAEQRKIRWGQEKAQWDAKIARMATATEVVGVMPSAEGGGVEKTPAPAASEGPLVCVEEPLAPPAASQPASLTGPIAAVLVLVLVALPGCRLALLRLLGLDSKKDEDAGAEEVMPLTDGATVPVEPATATNGPIPVPDRMGDLVVRSSTVDDDQHAAPVALPAAVAEGPEQGLEAVQSPRGGSHTLEKALRKIENWVKLCISVGEGRTSDEEVRRRSRDCPIRANELNRVLKNNPKVEADDRDFKLIYTTLTLILALWNHPRGLKHLVPPPLPSEQIEALTTEQQQELISSILAHRQDQERTSRYARLAGDTPLCGRCGLVTVGDQYTKCICHRALVEHDRELLPASLHVLVKLPDAP